MCFGLTCDCLSHFNYIISIFLNSSINSESNKLFDIFCGIFELETVFSSSLNYWISGIISDSIERKATTEPLKSLSLYLSPLCVKQFHSFLHLNNSFCCEVRLTCTADSAKRKRRFENCIFLPLNEIKQNILIKCCVWLGWRKKRMLFFFPQSKGNRRKNSEPFKIKKTNH